MHKDISRIERTIPELRNLLLQNEDIRKLLVYDTSDALTLEAPTIETAKEYISLYPVIEQGIITTDRNTAIALDLTAVDTDFEEGDSAILATIIISVLCTDKVLLLDNNKFRHWEVARLIINDVDEFKGSASGKFTVTGGDRFINKHYYGVAVKILVSDDATETEF
jgi:hypothetical protein